MVISIWTSAKYRKLYGSMTWPACYFSLYSKTRKTLPFTSQYWVMLHHRDIREDAANTIWVKLYVGSRTEESRTTFTWSVRKAASKHVCLQHYNFFSSKVERNLKHYTSALGGHLIQKLLLYYNLKEQIATGGSLWVLFQG